MPRIKKSVIGSDDVQAFSNLGDAPPELNMAGTTAADIQVVPMDRMEAKAAEAKFMEEKVLIEIEAEDDPNAAVFVHLGHNGVTQYVKRGEPQAIKRKFLYSALAAKTVKFACAFGKDNSGNEFNRMNPSAKTTHRMRLIEDRNPQGGMKWFQKVASQA